MAAGGQFAALRELGRRGGNSAALGILRNAIFEIHVLISLQV
jgi:hypothetical protein